MFRVSLFPLTSFFSQGLNFAQRGFAVRVVFKDTALVNGEVVPFMYTAGHE
jgi:hypothetical protein